jgi:hypothetical protein
MRVTEKVFIVMGLIALAMKLGSVPGNGVLITLSVCLLASFYIILGFALFNGIGFRGLFKANSYRGVRITRFLFGTVTGFTLTNMLVGILFKVQYWPGAETVLIGGISAGILVTIIAATRFFMTRSATAVRVLQRAVPILIFAAVLFYTPSTGLLKIFKVTDPEIEREIRESGR